MRSQMLRGGIMSAALIALAGGLHAAPPPNEALQRVLQRVPAQPDFLVIVPRLDALFDGLQSFTQAIDARGAKELRFEALAAEVLGPGKDLVLAAGPFLLAQNAGQEEPLLYALLKPNAEWAGAEEAGRVGDVTFYRFADGRQAAQLGNDVVVFARERRTIEAVAGSAQFLADHLPEGVAELLPKQDLVVWANVPAWRDMLRFGLAFISQSFYMGITQSGSNADTLIQFYRIAFDRLSWLVGEMETYTLGVSLGADGVRVQDRLVFRAGGAVARYLAEIPAPQGNVLRGLRKVGMMSFGCEWNPPPGVATLNELFTRAMLESSLLRQRIGPEKLEAGVRYSIGLNRLMSGFSTTVEIAGADEGLVISGLYFSDQGPALFGRLCEGFDQHMEFIQALSQYPFQPVRKGHETLNGVEAVIQYFEVDGSDARTREMVRAMYGAQPALYAAPHPKGVVFALGSADVARTRCAALLADDGVPLADDARVHALLANFSAQPHMVMVFDIPETVRVLAEWIRRSGIPVAALNVSGGDAPLAGIACYAEPAALRCESFVPARAIRVVVDEVHEIEAQQRGER